jgi:hypothetical protein
MPCDPRSPKGAELKIVRFQDVPTEQWDKWVGMIGDASYLHSSMFLTYLHNMVKLEDVLTFAFVENMDNPVALCPLGICKTSIGDMEFREASWNGAPLGAPVFREMRPGPSGKLQRAVFEFYHQLVREHGGRRCYVRRHAISLSKLAGRDTGVSQMSILAHGYICLPQNTSIVELSCSEDELMARLSITRRQCIRTSQQQRLRIVAFGAGSEDSAEMFKLYQRAHFESAGRLTRPQKTFDLMMQYVQEGSANLFVAFARDTPVGFLHCGIFRGMAFGWSLANVEEYEREYSPRAPLEWEAMLHYKRAGLKYFETGIVFQSPQPYRVPSAKELVLSAFARRYGGTLYPDLCFERIFDAELWRHINEARTREFLASSYFAAGEAPQAAESQ